MFPELEKTSEEALKNIADLWLEGEDRSLAFLFSHDPPDYLDSLSERSWLANEKQRRFFIGAFLFAVSPRQAWEFRQAGKALGIKLWWRMGKADLSTAIRAKAVEGLRRIAQDCCVNA